MAMNCVWTDGGKKKVLAGVCWWGSSKSSGSALWADRQMDRLLTSRQTEAWTNGRSEHWQANKEDRKLYKVCLKLACMWMSTKLRRKETSEVKLNYFFWTSADMITKFWYQQQNHLALSKITNL